MPALHRLFGLLLLAGAALLMNACDSGDGGGPPEPSFDRAAMLSHLGNDLIIPAYEQLQDATRSLVQATDAFAADPTETTLTAAQQALRTARLAWQEAAPYQFGPAESVALRASLNTYPADVGRIEANVASGSYVLGSIADRAAGGFPALDYLLHGAPTAETLAHFATAADAATRTAYLQDNAAFIQSNVDATAAAWQPSGGNYIGTFLSDAKAGVDVGSALGELVNALVLHYERFLRDGKIGIPAGVRSAGVPRPAAVEAYYGGYSLELAQAAVAAVERLYLGTGPGGADGPGLDEHLQALDAAALSAEIRTSLAATRAALTALSDPLAAQIETDNDAVVAAFTTMQDLVVLFKADLTSVLGITITFQDNDGD